MRDYIVSIVGKPNVGKSTLFNIIAEKRIAITSEIPGVTRDRIFAKCEWSGKTFNLFDTAGIEENSSMAFSDEMKEQVETAIAVSDVIVFLVDAKNGMTKTDEYIANMLRKSKKRIVLSSNKLDNFQDLSSTYEFYELSLGEPIPISATNMTGIGDLLDEITKDFNENSNEKTESDLKLAIIGKPNAGKSTLINSFLKENRVIVSDKAGTTRDSIDIEITRNGKKIILTDTAGIKRKSKVKEKLEKYSLLRAIAAIERSDIAVLLIDVNEGITEADQKILGMAEDAGKGLIICFNKWDEIENKEEESKELRENVLTEFSFASFAPVLFISAKESIRTEKLLEDAFKVFENLNKKIPTHKLNTLISEWTLIAPPPTKKGEQLKIYYVSQIRTAPPIFVFKVNDRNIFHFSYARYLEKKIRDSFGFEGVPIRFVFKDKKD